MLDRGATEYISTDDQKKHDYSSKEEVGPVNTREEEPSQIEPQKKKTKWWTDRLPSVPKNERKLITRVIGVVRDCVDETTMNKILDKIEEEFK